MKTLFFLIALLCICSSSLADVYVSGYTKNNGTYVQPYYRSSPNSSQYDNYSTKGNVNPYTGESGYKTQEYKLNNPIYNSGTATHPLGKSSYPGLR
jgi:hypothetical protein